MTIVGHENNIRYLSEGLKTHRLSPSLLFVGPEGVGKKWTAFNLAQAFSCQQRNKTKPSLNQLACHECNACQRMASNQHPDLLFIDFEWQATALREKRESQTAIKIEAVRFLDRFLHIKPIEATHRVGIIDGSQKMTTESANALLKTLEEPPPNSQIILLATDERNLPSTVVSRCALLKFRPLSQPLLSSWLETHHQLSKSKADQVANRAKGSFSKALSLIDEEDPIDSSDIRSLDPDEFFDFLSSTLVRGSARKNADSLVASMIEVSQNKLEEGDLTQLKRLRALLKAKRQLGQMVSPKFVLENLYLTL